METIYNIISRVLLPLAFNCPLIIQYAPLNCDWWGDEWNSGGDKIGSARSKSTGSPRQAPLLLYDSTQRRLKALTEYFRKHGTIPGTVQRIWCINTLELEYLQQVQYSIPSFCSFIHTTTIFSLLFVRLMHISLLTEMNYWYCFSTSPLFVHHQPTL